MVRLLTVLFLLLSGCSTTPPLPDEGVNSTLTPQQAAETNRGVAGKRVLWGGVIIGSHHLKERTRLEVLAYPLDRGQRPLLRQPATGRFLAYYPGYLESVDYAGGREISMTGTISGSETGAVGEHPYRYPVIEVEQFHLWPVSKPHSEPRFQFGIGVILHN